jgi:thiaminase/transcriptional activator TenA
MTLAKTLWEENADLARAALEHRFVRGLGNGDLPLGSFQEYIAQDAFFLEAFARAYALALAHSPDRQGLRYFAELLAGVLEELELHGKYTEGWGVELTGVVPGEATLAYTDFLLTIAALRSIGETCAAMTPCMRLYAFLGQSCRTRGSTKVTSTQSGSRPTPPPTSRTLRPRLKACWTATQRIPPP